VWISCYCAAGILLLRYSFMEIVFLSEIVITFWFLDDRVNVKFFKKSYAYTTINSIVIFANKSQNYHF